MWELTVKTLKKKKKLTTIIFSTEIFRKKMIKMVAISSTVVTKQIINKTGQKKM